MRTPFWESSAGALAALLNSTAAVELVWCDVFTITLVGGTVLRWSGTDIPVTINGTTWSLGPGIVRGRLRRGRGISVDTLQVTLYPGDISIATSPLAQYIARGGFDNARLESIRAFKLASSVGWTGEVDDSTGRISGVKPDREQVSLNVKSDTELFDVMVPREVYQPGCTNTLYDTACAVSRASRTLTGTTATGTDINRIQFTINPTGAVNTATVADKYYALGVIKFTSGACAGVARTIKRHQGQVTPGVLPAQVITVLQPLPAEVASGDAFEIYPGCDKTKATCEAKFSNLIRFRGHPYIPAPETIT